ncbi:MAG: LTA synthase family protein [Eggerthellaceae bacterium]|nr:LTA synthase family protein [Eggerthellaceae bacterium]
MTDSPITDAKAYCQAHREGVLAAVNWAFLLMAAPILCAAIAETLSLSGVAGLEEGFFLLNALIYLFAHLVLYLVVRNTRIACLLVLLVVVGFSIANHYVIAFTGIPITFGDLMSVGVGMAVAGGYTYTLDPAVVACLIAAFVYAALLIAIPCSKIQVSFRSNQMALALVAVAAVGMGAYLYGDEDAWSRIDTHEWNPAYPYLHYGFAASLASDVASASTVEADGYDSDALWQTDESSGVTQVNVGHGYVTEADGAPAYREATEESPNIVVVMNESFSDLTSYLEGYETSTDPMPFVRSLMQQENVISGTCAVSSDMGTGTANSEFEFLTGNSMAYFRGNTPYVQFIDTETPSLASELAGRGYRTQAMHAYERAGYNRVKVYDRFGFQQYKGIEDFDVDIDVARGYPTDETNYRQLIKDFEENRGGAPQFLFNITMQNHGGYYASDYEWPVRVHEVAPVESYDDSVIAYESSVRMADDALRQLISYLETVDEPTVLLFFGDHEPRLSNEFYSSWFTDENGLDLETTAQLHKTPFFIWGNYDLNTDAAAKGSTVSLNYLSTVLFQAAGIKLSPYQEYLADLRMEHPVITARYFTDAFGSKIGSTPTAFTDSIREYQWLQYNCVFDRAHRIPGFYS